MASLGSIPSALQRRPRSRRSSTARSPIHARPDRLVLGAAPLGYHFFASMMESTAPGTASAADDLPRLVGEASGAGDADGGEHRADTGTARRFSVPLPARSAAAPSPRRTARPERGAVRRLCSSGFPVSVCWPTPMSDRARMRAEGISDMPRDVLSAFASFAIVPSQPRRSACLLLHEQIIDAIGAWRAHSILRRCHVSFCAARGSRRRACHRVDKLALDVDLAASAGARCGEALLRTGNYSGETG